MVSTVRPKAKETPRRPMPTPGKAAARTALPQPPKTSQNVPKTSAAIRRAIGCMGTPFPELRFASETPEGGGQRDGRRELDDVRAALAAGGRCLERVVVDGQRDAH